MKIPMSDEPTIEKPTESIPEPTESITEPTDSGSEKNITIKKSSYNKMIKGIVVAIAIATFLGGYSIGTMQISDDGLSKDDMRDVIDAYVAEQGVAAPTPTQQPTQPSAPQIIQVSLDDDPVKGNPDAEVIVVEFSDFQCPFCSRFYDQTLPLIQQNYIDTGKIKFVYRDFPLDSLHPNARPAHIAAECADEQGKFWEYHDVLFDKQSEWNRLPSADLQSTQTQYASDLGLQSASFENCLKSDKIADEVNKDALDAARVGATGTPAFFIGNEKDGFIKLSGAQPFPSFQAVIDAQLE